MGEKWQETILLAHFFLRSTETRIIRVLVFIYRYIVFIFFSRYPSTAYNDLSSQTALETPFVVMVYCVLQRK